MACSGVVGGGDRDNIGILAVLETLSMREMVLVLGKLRVQLDSSGVAGDIGAGEVDEEYTTQGAEARRSKLGRAEEEEEEYVAAPPAAEVDDSCRAKLYKGVASSVAAGYR